MPRIPRFALAHYSLALNSPTAKEFFDHLKEAVKLSGKASDGERLMILGLEAGANADPEKQREYYERTGGGVSRATSERTSFWAATTSGSRTIPRRCGSIRASVEIAPDFAPAYNLLGYAYRQVGQYDDAEKAFKKYIELIPNDPNPYDSYAELLMKMGRFDESIAHVSQGAGDRSQFSPSHIGIASNLMYQGKHEAVPRGGLEAAPGGAQRCRPPERALRHRGSICGRR